MDSYQSRDRTETISTVSAQEGDPGTADVSLALTAGRWGEHTVELNSRVSREDLPKLIDDLVACVMYDERAALLERLTEKWAR